MDRREAIEILSGNYQVAVEDSKAAKEHNEALDLAIEALEQPEIVRCKGCNYFLGAGEDTFCGLCSREDTQGVAESATTTHGRLVDADALAEDIRQKCLADNTPMNIAIGKALTVYLLEAPTIVPANPKAATITDCNYTCSDCKHRDRTYEQEPCHSCFNNDGAGYEPDTDCISRADTIKAMCRECKVFLGDGVNCADCTEVAIVKGMPPCNQKQVTGKLENAENATSEGEESTMGQPKSELDCISRQQAIDVVHKYFVDAIDKTPHEIDEDGYDVYTDMKSVNELLKHNKHISKAIKTLPPVTPTERTTETMIVDGEETEIDPVSYEIGYSHGQVAERTGEWEKFSFPDGDVMECTNCGYRDWADVWEEGSRNYCPNCGCAMTKAGDTE